jgi:hypothetical protein
MHDTLPAFSSSLPRYPSKIASAEKKPTERTAAIPHVRAVQQKSVSGM